MTGVFDRNESAFIKQQIRSSVNNEKLATVAQVFEHDSLADNNNHEVDAIAFGGEEQYRSIPYESKSSNEVDVPTVGDVVVVEFREGEKTVPLAKNAVHTAQSRAPLAKAGMWRKKIDSGSSPAGDGDLYVESYTDWDVDPSTDETESASAESAFIRLAKKVNDDDIPQNDALPMVLELFDDPSGGDAHIRGETNQSAGSMKFELDTDNQIATIEAKDGDIKLELDMNNNQALLSGQGESMGVRLNFDTGEFTLVDGSGYGIESDGSGNFTWHHETIDFSEGTTTSL